MYIFGGNPQNQIPMRFCERCGCEIYEDKPDLCHRCRVRKERSMSLRALSEEYRQSAALLGGRIDALHEQLQQTTGAERERMNRRLAQLCTMYRQTLRTAAELEHYYDPS